MSLGLQQTLEMQYNMANKLGAVSYRSYPNLKTCMCVSPQFTSVSHMQQTANREDPNDSYELVSRDVCIAQHGQSPSCYRLRYAAHSYNRTHYALRSFRLSV